MIFCKPKLVKFKTGGFGTRKFTLEGYVFMSSTGKWWGRADDVTSFCKFKTVEEAVHVYKKYNIESDLLAVKCD